MHILDMGRSESSYVGALSVGEPHVKWVLLKLSTIIAHCLRSFNRRPSTWLDITHRRLSNLIINSLRIKENICLTAAKVLETACLDTVTKELGNPISQMN